MPAKGSMDARQYIENKRRDAQFKLFQKQRIKGHMGQQRSPPGFMPRGLGQTANVPRRPGPPLGPRGPQRFGSPSQPQAQLRQAPGVNQPSSAFQNPRAPPPFNKEQRPPMQQQRPQLRSPLPSQQTPPFGFPQQRPPRQQRPTIIMDFSPSSGGPRNQRPPFRQQRPPIMSPRPAGPRNQTPPLRRQRPTNILSPSLGGPQNQRPPHRQQRPLPQQQGPPFNQQAVRQQQQQQQQPPPTPFRQNQQSAFSQVRPFHQPLEFNQPQQPSEFMAGQFEPFQPEFDPPFDQNAFHGAQGLTAGKQFGQQGQDQQLNQTPQAMQPFPSSSSSQPPTFMVSHPPGGQGFNPMSGPSQRPPASRQLLSGMDRPPPSGFAQPLFNQPAQGFQPIGVPQDDEDIDFMIKKNTVVEDTGTSLRITRTTSDVSFHDGRLTVTRRVSSANETQIEQGTCDSGGRGAGNFNIRAAGHFSGGGSSKAQPPPPKKKFRPIPIKAPSPTPTPTPAPPSNLIKKTVVKTGGPTLLPRAPPASAPAPAENARLQMHQQPPQQSPRRPTFNRPGSFTPTVDTVTTSRHFKTVGPIAEPTSRSLVARTVSFPEQASGPNPGAPSPLAAAAAFPDPAQQQQQQRLSAHSRLQPSPDEIAGPSGFSSGRLNQTGLRMGTAQPAGGQDPTAMVPTLPSPSYSFIDSLHSVPTVDHSMRQPFNIRISQASLADNVGQKRPAMRLTDRFTEESLKQSFGGAKKLRLTEPQAGESNVGNLESEADMSQGFTVQVSNLHRQVTQEDVIDLFGSLGPLKRARLLPNGRADVAFVYEEHALQAIQNYHDRELDGQPLFLKLVTPLNARVMQASEAGSADSPTGTRATVVRKKQSSQDTTTPVDNSLVRQALFKPPTDAATAPKPVAFTVRL